jgi:pantetheine-phosphate adenylyltransferase
MSKKTSPKKSPRIAIYPGSFDPITLGHVDIIERIAKLYDEVIVLVAQSADKSSFLTVDERISLIRKSLKNLDNVRVDSHQGLTVEYARKWGAQVLVRGLRAIVDFEYEASLGNINKTIDPNIETVLVFASPEYYFISSRMVKDVAKNKGPLKGLVPAPVIEALKRK